MKLNDDSMLKESAKAKSKPSNAAMIKAIDSDDAFDYLRVRKQNGVSKTKLIIKKATVFDKVAPESEEGPSNELALDPFNNQKNLIDSDESSILGDRWYDEQKKGLDFKFEVNSNVDSIEFPMNKNLNLKLNL